MPDIVAEAPIGIVGQEEAWQEIIAGNEAYQIDPALIQSEQRSGGAIVRFKTKDGKEWYVRIFSPNPIEFDGEERPMSITPLRQLLPFKETAEMSGAACCLDYNWDKVARFLIDPVNPETVDCSDRARMTSLTGVDVFDQGHVSLIGQVDDHLVAFIGKKGDDDINARVINKLEEVGRAGGYKDLRVYRLLEAPMVKGTQVSLAPFYSLPGNL